MANPTEPLFFSEAIVFLGAAVVAVPIAKRAGVGAIIGYLIAGIVIGPFGLGAIQSVEKIQPVAELGVVLLLFVLGLELNPNRLWRMKSDIFGLGTSQILLTGFVLSGVMILLGLPNTVAIIGGFGMALSSTAFAVQILKDRGDFSSVYGQRAFGILLMQDIAIVPLLAMVDILVSGGATHAESSAWNQIGITVAAVLLVIVVGKYLLSHLFAILANTQAREMMLAAALLVALGSAALMHWAGLSMALGSFLAGIMLAESSYRHTLEADIFPFRSLLMGLFFMTVGMTLNLPITLAYLWQIIVGVIVVMGLKGLVLWLLAKMTGSPNSDAMRIAITLPQAGEFTFVLFAAATSTGFSFQLGGLLAGAVLGSGIILLPPIALARLGDWSVLGWGAILSLGAIFAGLFAKLALVYPGAEGVPIAVRNAFGPRAGQLASSYVICAVCAGPLAVLMTAADTMARAFNLSAQSMPVISGGLLVLCAGLLVRRVTVVGSVALLASIGIGGLLAAGSVTTLVNNPVSPFPTTHLDISDMGRALLVLFWAIIGWEIIGNYSKEVRDPHRTIPMATILGVGTISVLYVLVAWAIFAVSPGNMPEGLSVVSVVEPLLGDGASVVVMIMTTLLCICTYLMIVGGVSRLIGALAQSGRLPAGLARNNANGAPIAGMALLMFCHCLGLVLLYWKFVSLEQIIAVANVFFLANSLIAVMAAMRIFRSMALRISGVVLCAGFVGLLAFSSLWPLLALAVVTICVLGKKVTEGILSDNTPSKA